ncbi:PrsW family intramembrane metalloprotease [Streptomyces sp. TLI_171]|uniref:PrsW family intramembrane metalloprotease n=1 Tax=Streptomyces sp. TLI_171 TaxID=1938859 RepID=UPI000C177869|nr:PrsW family intramembrane metalloprotease [Streptomyces sp. TLI_171]RKE20544.1 RsiW-degrading membrane proteinase PrsW (M82 family) [Streptomyces sp. TLI_171]
MSSPPSGKASPGLPDGAAAMAAESPTPPTGLRSHPEPAVRRSDGLLAGLRPVPGGRIPAQQGGGRPVRRARSLARRLWPLRRPALSSAVAALALAGSGVLILHLVQRQTGTTGLLVGLGLALLPLPFVLGSLAWLNQTARVPIRHTLFCLAWGACAATTVAIMANGWASDFLIAHQGARGETLGAEFATPLIEEVAKGSALLMLLLPLRRRHRCEQDRPCGRLRRLLWHRRGSDVAHFRPAPAGRQRARSSPRTLAAGTVLGGVTACGFAFTENALYLGRAFTADRQARLDAIGLGQAPSLRDFDGTVHTFVLRALLSPFAHPLFTALTGLGLAITLTTGRRWLASIGAPVGLLLAMALHGVWNAAAGLGTDGFLLVYGLVMVPCFAALVCFAVWAQTRRTRQPARPA